MLLGSVAVVLLSLLARAMAADESPIDFQRAKQIFQRRQAGETLSAEDQAYLSRAMELRQRQQQGGGTGQPGGSNRPGLPSAPPATKSTGLVPLTDLQTGEYKGQTGGLYGEGKNEPPAEHRAAVEKQLRLIEPLDADGQPSPDGKVALLSIGMSNTTMEYQAFKQQAEADPRKSPNVVIVDGAQGGVVASRWAGTQPMPGANAGAAGRTAPGRNADPWAVLDKRLNDAGVTPQQVQACWMKQAQGGPAQQGEFPKHAEILADNIILTLGKLHERFPNLRVVYLSSRVYAGYALTGLNPEPYAYEGAFANRWVIERQIKGDARLNFDPAKGTVTAPAVVWGPYLWADGVKPRSDRLVWLEDDLVSNDRTHPSPSGRAKVAKLLLDFMHDNPLASCWYLATPSSGK